MTDSGTPSAPTDPDEPAPGELDGAGRRRNGRESHGLHRAKRLLREANVRSRVMYAANTFVGRRNIEQRDALIKQAGGEDSLTPTMRVSIDEIVRVKMLQTFTDSFLAELGPKIVNRRRKTLVPVVEQRLRLSDALQKHVGQLEASMAARRDDKGDDIVEAWAKAVQDVNDDAKRAVWQAAREEEFEKIRADSRRQARLDHQREIATDNPQEAASPG